MKQDQALRLMKTGVRQDDLTNGNVSLDQSETATYIADVTLQLRNLAKKADLKFLVYLLEMSFQEAFSRAQKEKTDR